MSGMNVRRSIRRILTIPATLTLLALAMPAVPKGSLLAGHDNLLYRSADEDEETAALDGNRVALDPVTHDTTNPISYLVDCIRSNKPIENPLAGKLNVQVMEILDAARESACTGRAVELH